MPKKSHASTAISACVLFLVFLTGEVAAQAQITVSGAPIVDLGEEDGILAVEDVALGEDIFAVADPSTSQVSTYSFDGEFRMRFGGEGQGPGEFVSLSSIHWCDQAWVAWDARLDRISVVERSSDLRTTFVLPAVDGLLPQHPTCFEDRLLSTYVSVEGRPPGSYRPTAIVHEFGLDGDHVRRVGSFPADERTRHEGSDGPRLLGKVTLLVLSADGFWVGTGDDGFALSKYDFEGRRVGNAELAVPARPIERDDLQHMWNRQLGAAERYGPEVVERLRRNQLALEYPDSYPPYQSAFLDGNGRLWVKHYLGPRDTAERWEVFDAVGDHVATFQGPDGFRLTDVRGRFAVGIGTDALEAERAYGYELVWRE
jgi:hypothetical protein